MKYPIKRSALSYACIGSLFALSSVVAAHAQTSDPPGARVESGGAPVGFSAPASLFGQSGGAGLPGGGGFGPSQAREKSLTLSSSQYLPILVREKKRLENDLKRVQQQYKAGITTQPEVDVVSRKLEDIELVFQRVNEQVIWQEIAAKWNKKTVIKASNSNLDRILSTLSKASGLKITLDLGITNPPSLSIDAQGVPLFKILSVLATESDFEICPTEEGAVLKKWPHINNLIERSSKKPWSEEWDNFPIYVSTTNNGIDVHVNGVGAVNSTFWGYSPDRDNFGMVASSIRNEPAPLGLPNSKRGGRILGEEIASGATTDSPAEISVLAPSAGGARGGLSGGGGFPGGVLAPTVNNFPSRGGSSGAPAVVSPGGGSGGLSSPFGGSGRGEGGSFDGAGGVFGDGGGFSPSGMSGMAAPAVPFSFTSLGNGLVAVAEPGVNDSGQQGVWMTAYRFENGDFKRLKSAFHAFKAPQLSGVSSPFNYGVRMSRFGEETSNRLVLPRSTTLPVAPAISTPKKAATKKP